MANVNGLQESGSATGTDPSLSVVGTDTNRGLTVNVLGTGTLNTPAPVVSGKRMVKGLAAPSYGATVTPDASAGDWHAVTATNGTAFTIAAPANPPDSSHTQDLTIEILNSAGGALGAITWNAAFVLVGGAFTAPASTKRRFIRFGWNGANWVEIARAGADY